jgi:hypothetical protein
MAVLPWLKFFPGDWQRDTALRSCPVAARGLWIEMLMVMHQAEPYGHLVVNGKPIQPAVLARMVGASAKEVRHWLSKLEAAGVFDREGNVIVSRRMVRDERIRRLRAEGGKLGGNPALKDIHKGDTKVNHRARKVNPQKSEVRDQTSETAKTVCRDEHDDFLNEMRGPSPFEQAAHRGNGAAANI